MALSMDQDLDSDDDELLRPSVLTKPFEVTQDMVANVLGVCPGASRKTIIADLHFTRSVTSTINRVLDGVLVSEPHPKEQMSIASKLSPLISESKIDTTSACQIHVQDKSDVVCLSDTDIDTDTDEGDYDRNISKKKIYDADTIEVMEVDKEITSNQNRYQFSPLKQRQTSIHNTSEIIDLSFDGDDDDEQVFSTRTISKQPLKTNINSNEYLSENSNTDIGVNKLQPGQAEQSLLIDCDENEEVCEARITDISSSDSDSDNLPSVVLSMKDRILSARHNQESHERPAKHMELCQPSSSQSNVDVMDIEESCVPTKRKKHTDDDTLIKKEQAKLKKEEREKEKKAKKEAQEKEKQAKQEARLAKRNEKEMEKLLKKADSMDQKSQRKEECLKNIEVFLDPEVLSSKDTKDVNPLIEKLTSLEVSYSLQSHPIPECITWKRAAVKHTVGKDLKIREEKTLIDEKHVVVRVDSDLFVSMVDVFKKTRSGCIGIDSSPHSIESFCRALKTAYHEKTIFLLVVGLEKYFRELKSRQARQYRNTYRGETNVEKSSSRKKQTPAAVILSQVDVEEFLVYVELTTEYKITLCESMQDFADTVAMVTKAVAEAPFKKAQPQAFSFCVDSFKSSVKVTKEGEGFLKLWQQQLQQFNNVSATMAAAIVAAYPSPQVLMKAYEECPNQQSATLLLKDILVRRGTGVLATSRRIGPELSRQIYLYLNATDGETLTK